MRKRRYYGEKMLADGTDASYPPTPSQEQQWRDQADYNAYPIGSSRTGQVVTNSSGRIISTQAGPVKTAYGKTISEGDFGGPRMAPMATYGQVRTAIDTPKRNVPVKTHPDR